MKMTRRKKRGCRETYGPTTTERKAEKKVAGEWQGEE